MSSPIPVFRYLAIALIAASGLPFTQATTYHFSESTGDDNNPGTYDAPMQSLAKASSLQLSPGDEVLFKRGDIFAGHFAVNGSGSAFEPIVISSYGEGDLPILTGQVGEAGGGDYQEAVLVENQDNITFEFLEIQNERLSSRPGIDDIDAYGIQILNTSAGIMENFTFRNLTVRKVYAPKPILRDEGEDAFNGLEVAGIRFFTAWNAVAGNEKQIRNILVEDCFFTDLQRLGIHIKHGGASNGVGNDELNRNKDIIVRNNEFQNTGGTCVLPIRTYNCLIENNLFYRPGSDADSRMPNRGSSVWTWRCINTVIQYNRCISTRGYLDSHGIHIDHENLNTFVQYNYMEDCEGGFVEILGGNVNSVYRFNVSVNDGWRDNPNWKNSNHTIWINEKGPGDTVHRCEHTYIYNNTVYMDRDFSTAIDIDGKHTYIYNNIFHAEGGDIGGKQVVVENNGTELFMRNNLFSGNIDSRFQNMDTAPIEGTPIFDRPGETNKYAYQLQASSPAINAGTTQLGPPIPGAGTGVFKDLTPYPKVDFYGNPIDLSSGTPNIGACNAKNGEIQSRPLSPISKIRVFPNQLHTQNGSEEKLTALASPALADDTSIVWSSDNASVATVDVSGTVTTHSEGVALLTAKSDNGQSDSCYIIVGNVSASMSANARQWMWDNQLDPNQSDLADTAPTGNPLLIHYALDTPPSQAIQFQFDTSDNRITAHFKGSRSDLSYSALAASDLEEWQTTSVSPPDSQGMRSLSVSSPASNAGAFFKIQVTPN
ncbi:Ig-like domain-containing protein [Pelagicoccus mobilis]|uniref:Ig-like domain-containing protein n=1 Tax=Pelagicoccus mobilis TaxID=415221 RepID=A0A934RZA4_9BACT|nr:Ig-like domain-containing protein [Pelagicoccus mobilis]MBK1879073.1 Ig-like domain-containing protein [Pelagicoccus mobilis]